MAFFVFVINDRNIGFEIINNSVYIAILRDFTWSCAMKSERILVGDSNEELINYEVRVLHPWDSRTWKKCSRSFHNGDSD